MSKYGTTLSEFGAFALQQLISSGQLSKLPTSTQVSSEWSQRSFGELTALAREYPIDVQLELLQKKWIHGAMDLHACVQSRSPLAIACLSQFSDLLYRLISLPLTVEEIAWVRQTFKLDANQVGKKKRTILSCVSHCLLKRDKRSAVAVHTLRAYGYVFSESDFDVLTRKHPDLSQHEIVDIIQWALDCP